MAQEAEEVWRVIISASADIINGFCRLRSLHRLFSLLEYNVN